MNAEESEIVYEALYRLVNRFGTGRHMLTATTRIAGRRSVTEASAFVTLVPEPEPHVHAYGAVEQFSYALVSAIGWDNGSLISRSFGDGIIIVRGWFVDQRWLSPMSEGEVFANVCTDPDGTSFTPDPELKFQAGFPL
ncbi:hypothetical protein ACWD01_37270 [Streptomyces sp. NPDC002835]